MTSYPFPPLTTHWSRWHDGYRGCVDVYSGPPARDVWTRIFGQHAWMALVPTGRGSFLLRDGFARTRRGAFRAGRKALREMCPAVPVKRMAPR